MIRTADDADGRADHGRATGIPARSEPDWHDESVLIAELATANTRLTRHITALLDVDAKRQPPVGPADEASLGQALVDLGHQLLQRAARRAIGPDVVDGAVVS